MASKDDLKKPADSQSAEANNTTKKYNSPVMSVYGRKGGEQHKLKFYHIPTRKTIQFPAFLTAFNNLLSSTSCLSYFLNDDKSIFFISLETYCKLIWRSV